MKLHEFDRHATQETDPLRADITRTLSALQEAIVEFPREATQLLQAVEMGIVRDRDRLIGDLRQSPNHSESNPLRRQLSAANTCLSLVVGVEYPQGRQHLSPLNEASRLLQEILEWRERQSPPPA